MYFLPFSNYRIEMEELNIYIYNIKVYLIKNNSNLEKKK